MPGFTVRSILLAALSSGLLLLTPCRVHAAPEKGTAEPARSEKATPEEKGAEAERREERAPDNTAVNKRDRKKAEPTADQQKENPNDREITRQIRRSIIKDKALSSYAHNVKIITQDGNVTLKGPVKSEEEKMAVEAKAVEVAGRDKVTSQVEVK